MCIIMSQKQFTSKMEENSPDTDKVEYENNNNHLNDNEQTNDIKTSSKVIQSKVSSASISHHEDTKQKNDNRYDEQDQVVQKVKEPVIVPKIKKNKQKKDSIYFSGVKKQTKNSQKIKKDDKDIQKHIGFAQQIQDHKKEVLPEKEEQKQQKIVIEDQKYFQKQHPAIKSNTSTPIIKSLKSLKSINGNQEQFQRAAIKTKQTFRSSRSCCEDYLEHIFNFYCKLSYPLHQNPTFDQINQKVKTMPITNFMAFCRDFKLREHFTREKLVEAFKKNSSFHKYLTPQQFHSAIENLAEEMYERYEEDRRFNKMLVFLQLHNSYSFVQKMNQLGVIFRMKNKRGKQVRNTPKYTFKLTPNNGKCEEQIALEVKQRTKIRRQLKQQQKEWHRKNKLNKIDELYRNGVKKSNFTISNQSSIHRITKLKCSNKSSNRGYYNPCQILSVRADGKSYIKINEIKKMISVSRLKQHQSDRSNELTSSLNPLQERRKMKINQVIEKAKNSILEQKHQNQHEQQEEKRKLRSYGYIHRQNLQGSYVSELTDSRHVPSPFVMKEVTNRAHLNNPRKQNQILQVQNMIQRQLKNISKIIQQDEAKPKQFWRATAKLQKQNSRQMLDLEEMTGVNEEDEILKQHFNLQKRYEDYLSKIDQRKY